VNALLESDRRTNKHDLSIQRYAVAPLSHNAGVVGWVPNTDTLHALIRDYRETRKILLNIEHRLMVQMAPDFDALTVMQKLEVFEAALENTAGQDLYRVLWLKSDNSEQWLDRRTTYTRSLAVMSVVGYILGLGDRHPSNLMLDRNTGKILHIDFGDCFEVAMHRDKFPEKIPFRLTRMLVNAMEVSGIEGNYRSTCEHVMGVMRENRDSLLAMLQAFVHDPLISWRLLGAVTKPASAGPLPTGTPPLPPVSAAAVAPHPAHPAAFQSLSLSAAASAAASGLGAGTATAARRAELETELAQVKENPALEEEAAIVMRALAALSEDEAQERSPDNTPPAVSLPPPEEAAVVDGAAGATAIPIRRRRGSAAGSGQAGSVSDSRFEAIQSMAASLRESDPTAASVMVRGRAGVGRLGRLSCARRLTF
jgi:FKBP12-rapamycin complex-associated protein